MKYLNITYKGIPIQYVNKMFNFVLNNISYYYTDLESCISRIDCFVFKTEEFIDAIKNIRQQKMNRINTWNEISKLLMDTSEENHKWIDIPLDYHECQGLSTNDMPHINQIWQDDKEDIITFKLQGYDGEYDLSEEPLYILRTVLNYLKKYQ